MLDAAAVAEAVYQERYESIKKYVDLLATEGVTRGLIGPRETDRLWVRHILNSAAVTQLIPAGTSVVDVGSGAGLPGIPLAILRPDLDLVLLEPLLRRATFLSEVVDALGLDERVTVTRARAEDHRAEYDVVLSRAVAPLARLLGWCAPLRRRPGVILAMKGRSAQAEVTEASVVLRSLKLDAEVRLVQLHADVEPATVVRVGSVGR